jgi:hypothetical protein
MSQLQHLTLEMGSDQQPLQLGVLPGSVTYLNLANCTVSGSSSLQLPLLQELELKVVKAVNTPEWERMLLTRAVHLRKLSITCRHAGDFAGAWAALPQLQQLQDIYIFGLSSWPEAGHYAGLTASSQLTSLQLALRSLPAGAVQRMFSAERQLPLLQVLCVSSSSSFSSKWHVGPGDVPSVVKCCPSLRSLCSESSSVLYPDSSVSQGELQQLLQLTELEALAVGGACWGDSAVQGVLAEMTGRHHA